MIRPGSDIIVVAHAQYRAPILGVARRLKAEFGARLHMYCNSIQQVEYYNGINGDGLFATINDANVLEPACRETPPPYDEVLKVAVANEADLGVTYNEISVSDRHLGRGYALGGHGHPRSRTSEQTDYHTMLHGINALVNYWRRQFEEKRPVLIVNPGMVPLLTARRFGVPIRWLAGSRYKQYAYWSDDEFGGNPRLEGAYAKIANPPPADIDAPYDDHLRWRAHFRKRLGLKNTLKSSAELTARRAYWHLRGYEKAKGYYLSEELKLTWRFLRDGRYQQRHGEPLSSLEGKRFVYYPLHVEPEIALQQFSPEWFAQLASIAALARDLPAGILLAVKETVGAMGLRPPKFYEQIREFKNVVMLDPQELGLEVVKRTDLVATITGTGGFEAASLGVPVISFGRHNVYNFLPHVRVITDVGSLKEPLNDLLGPGFDRAAAVRDGSRFLAAVIATSFNLEGFTTREPDQITDAVIERAYRGLLDSLAVEQERAAVPVRASA